jgi:hypothetical protein
VAFLAITSDLAARDRGVSKRDFSKASPVEWRSGRFADADPSDYVSPDGEIIGVAGTNITPHQRAKSELAAFNFG